MLRPLTTRLIPVGLVVLWGGALLLTVLSPVFEEEAARRVAFMAKQVGLSGVFLALAGVVLWAWTAGARAGRWALALTLLVGLLDVWHIGWGYLQTGPIALSPIWREASVDVPTGPAGGYGRVM